MPKNRSYRKNLQVAQPGIEYQPEGNGWPEPLTDTSNPVKHSYVNGKSGSIKSRSITSLSAGNDVSEQGAD